MGFFRILRKRGAAAGLDPSRLHPHLLRHTFATHMLEEGASLRIVQELLGHRSLTTTEIYTAVDQATLRKVHRRFHPRGGGSI
jgi:integrase/recombinase XerD